MVKKSFLGRLFGKRETPSRHEGKAPEVASDRGSGTTTLAKKAAQAAARKEGGTARPGDGGARAAGSEKGRIESSKRPVPEAADRGPTPRARERTPPAKPVEPEILDPTTKAASESREKIDVIAKKMTAQEEMTIKISDGIKGLSSILSNIDQRLEEQTQQSYEMVRTVKTIPDALKDLPESSRAGVELLQAISQVLENQSLATAELGQRIAGLPELLQNLGERMERENKERQEERSILKESAETVKISMDRLEKRHQELSHLQEDNTRKLVQSVRTIQSEYQNQVNRLIEKNRLTNRLILLMIFILAAGMISIVAVLLK